MAGDPTIQLYRGPESGRSGKTPAAGELTVTTDTDDYNGQRLFVGDGTTAGGLLVSSGTYNIGHNSGTRYGPSHCLLDPVAAAIYNNTAIWVPFAVGGRKKVTFDQIGYQQTVLGASGEEAKLGIYSDLDGKPNDRILETAAFDLNSATGVRVATISQALFPGPYWLAMNASAASATAQMRMVDNFGVLCMVGFSTGPLKTTGWAQVLTGPTLPDPAAPTLLGTDDAPLIFLRAQ